MRDTNCKQRDFFFFFSHLYFNFWMYSENQEERILLWKRILLFTHGFAISKLDNLGDTFSNASQCEMCY